MRRDPGSAGRTSPGRATARPRRPGPPRRRRTVADRRRAGRRPGGGLCGQRGRRRDFPHQAGVCADQVVVSRIGPGCLVGGARGDQGTAESSPGALGDRHARARQPEVELAGAERRRHRYLVKLPDQGLEVAAVAAGELPVQVDRQLGRAAAERPGEVRLGGRQCRRDLLIRVTQAGQGCRGKRRDQAGDVAGLRLEPPRRDQPAAGRWGGVPASAGSALPVVVTPVAVKACAHSTLSAGLGNSSDG